MENEKKTTTGNAEMVSVSRMEYESQQAQLTELKFQNQWLLEQLGLVKKRQFGSSSEKLREELMDQLSLDFNEAEAYAHGTKSATAEQVAVKAHARKWQSGSVTDIVPEGTPTEVVEHRPSEEKRACEVCGAVMEEINREVRRSLQMEPARFWIREDVYYTYACRNCEEESDEANIRKTPKQPALCPGSFASAEAAEEFLKGFSGWLHADGYQGYHKLPEIQPRAQRSGSQLERRSKGANAVFAAGGNGVERTLRRRVGHMHGENLMRLYKSCPKRSEEIPWLQLVSAIAPDCSNWKSLSRN